ncbi:MAG TPA: tetratricopeptide repeat protein [Vicinamibacterales bacterium]
MLRCAVLALVLISPAAARAQDIPAAEGWAALEAGDASKAAAIFRDALDRSPRNGDLHYGAAYAARMLGRTDAAMSSLRQALDCNPRLVPALVMQAQLAYETADLDLAIRSLEKAVALVPKNARLAKQLDAWRRESAVHGQLNQQAGVRFNVLFEGATEKPIADRISKVLESAYWRVGKTLNAYPSQTLSVILYSNRQFFDITRAPAWAGGGYDGRIRIPVGGALKTPADFDRVVTHEFVHAAIATAAPRGVPTWVNEGIATYLDSPNRAWARRVMREAPIVIPLEQLDGGFGRFDSDVSLIAYAESVIAAEVLFERLSTNVGVFLQLLDGGQSVADALTTLGVRPEEFTAAWKSRMGR